VLDELERAGPEGEAALGIEIAARTIRRLRNISSGVHVMAIGWEHRIPELLQAAGVTASEHAAGGAAPTELISVSEP
jgi:5,10-methylenetetrahydrofolate reductase